mgnify:CR=1 FL=1|tara:strand:- start:1972 stop:2994 length:1023 start_codon:yes stop_codon:yes gene_type:complete
MTTFHFATDMSSEFYSQLQKLLYKNNHIFYHLRLINDNRLSANNDIKSLEASSRPKLLLTLVFFLLKHRFNRTKFCFHSIFPFIFLIPIVGKNGIYIHRASDYHSLRKTFPRLLLYVAVKLGIKIKFKSVSSKRKLEKSLGLSFSNTSLLLNPLREVFFEPYISTVKDKEKSKFKILIIAEEHERKGIYESCIAGLMYSKVTSSFVKVEHIGVDRKEKILEKCSLLESKYFQFFHNSKKFRSKDIRDKIQNADVVMLPSINETFGMVYVEALATGRAVIGVKGEGLYGTYPISKQIIFSKSQEPKDLLEALKKVPEFSPNIKVIHDMFSPDNIIRCWSDI